MQQVLDRSRPHDLAKPGSKGGPRDTAEPGQTDDMARLEAALRPEAVSGPRYNEKAMAWVDR